MKLPWEIEERIRQIRLFLLDVDGVLTDGSITYDDRGGEIKTFNVKDGHGIKLLMRTGVDAGIITSRSSPVVERRARDLGIETVLQGRLDKAAAFREVLDKKDISASRVAYMGDDVVDLPVLLAAGLAIAPADAVEEVRAAAHVVTARPAGKGAVREAAELIMKVQGNWLKVLDRYRPGG